MSTQAFYLEWMDNRDEILKIYDAIVANRRNEAAVKKTVIDLLNQVKTIDGLIMGVTEDIPPERWQENCGAIMDGLDEHAIMRPDLYK